MDISAHRAASVQPGTRAAGIPPRSNTRRSTALVLAGAIALGGCAANQDSGTLIGAVGGAAAGAAIAGGSSERRIIGALIGAAAGGFAGSLIGKRLDEADRQRAEAAALKAIAEREAAGREQQQRTAQIEAQLRTEQARARTPQERNAADSRALEARQRVAQQGPNNSASPVTWSGNARGSAQAIGPTQVSGRDGCEQVREIAIIQGQEVRQTATFCRDPNTGSRVRV